MKAKQHASQLLDIWTFLPQTNCKPCEEVTCMVYVCNLLLRGREVVECSPLRKVPLFQSEELR